MDTKKMGMFVGELRKEKGWTQEELGEKLGITNKTVSRYETGVYSIPLDILERLADIFCVSIVELINGERIQEEDYRNAVEKAVSSTYVPSSFSITERIVYYKKKWINEHKALLILEVAILVLLICLLWNYSIQICILIGLIYSLIAYLYTYNRMMIYVEHNAF